MSLLAYIAFTTLLSWNLCESDSRGMLVSAKVLENKSVARTDLFIVDFSRTIFSGYVTVGLSDGIRAHISGHNRLLIRYLFYK